MCACGLDRQVEDRREQLRRRAPRRKLPAGLQQRRKRRHRIGGARIGGLLRVKRLFEVRADGRRQRIVFARAVEHHRLLGRAPEGHGDLPGAYRCPPAGGAACAAITGAVQERAVPAAEIDDRPALAIAFERHVLLRQAAIVGKREIARAQPSEHVAVALERDDPDYPAAERIDSSEAMRCGRIPARTCRHLNRARQLDC